MNHLDNGPQEFGQEEQREESHTPYDGLRSEMELYHTSRMEQRCRQQLQGYVDLQGTEERCIRLSRSDIGIF